MLLRFLISILITISLAGCYAYQAIYDVSLANVERPEDVRERYGEYEIVSFEEDGETKYTYEDEVVKITWVVLTKQLAFFLTNKSDNSIQIIWDEAAFVDYDGSTGRVIHSGVKYIDRNNSQPPTIIPKNAKVDDIVVPTDNIYYQEGQYGGWRINALFPTYAKNAEELGQMGNETVGKEIKVLLPLKIEDVVNEYTFTFKVVDFEAKGS